MRHPARSRPRPPQHPGILRRWRDLAVRAVEGVLRRTHPGPTDPTTDSLSEDEVPRAGLTAPVGNCLLVHHGRSEWSIRPLERGTVGGDM
jgi:hypothetical protein